MHPIRYALNKQEFIIHGCHLHEIWMEVERHTHSLCLWRDKLCGSQPHMKTGQLHLNEAQLSARLRHRESFLGMFTPNPLFCQSTKMAVKEKSTLLTMQGWTSLREDCGTAVRKLSLTYGSHILPHSLILESL